MYMQEYICKRVVSGNSWRYKTIKMRIEKSIRGNYMIRVSFTLRFSSQFVQISCYILRKEWGELSKQIMWWSFIVLIE